MDCPLKVSFLSLVPVCTNLSEAFLSHFSSPRPLDHLIHLICAIIKLKLVFSQVCVQLNLCFIRIFGWGVFLIAFFSTSVFIIICFDFFQLFLDSILPLFWISLFGLGSGLGKVV